MSSGEITIIGAGLAGLGAAWALQQDGWKVRVLDAREDVALETSYANAGMLTPSMADPWNAPGFWKHLLAWIGQNDAPMLLRLSALPSYWRWGLRFLQSSRPDAHWRATQANFALAQLSKQAFLAIREQLDLNYELRENGTMQIFQNAREFAVAQGLAERLRERGMPARILDRQGMLATEPLLADVAHRYLGAVHFPADETGDARRFCRGLADALVQRGVAFEFGCRVQAIRQQGGRVTALQTDQGERDCDQLVLAAAAWSPALLQPLGLDALIRPVKGYSLTIPVRDPAALPRLSLIDHHKHIALTPFDNRVRLAGTAEFSGFDPHLHPQRIEPLWRQLDALLPAQAEAWEREQAEPWCGFRPMSADAIPYIGPTAIQGLSLSTGHGHLGWTQSLGSGQLLAAILAGASPPIDPEPYAPQRC